MRQLLLVVACAALGGALAEIALLLIAKSALGRIALLNPQGIWLAPIGNFVLMLPAVLLGWALARWRRPHWAVPVGVAVAVFLALLEPLLLLHERVHYLALAALAAGVAIRVAVLVHEHPRAVRRALKWLFGGMAALVMSCTLGFNGSRAWRERLALQRLSTAPDGSPNVLLLVLDTVRALSLSVYGYGRPTSPTLERLAARGVVFDRAVATAPWTLPSHSSLFTGRYAHEVSAGYTTPLDAAFPTLAENLTSLGYQTAGFAGNLRYCASDFGLSRGFGYYRDYDVAPSEVVRSSALGRAVLSWVEHRSGRYSTAGLVAAERMNARFFDWLDDADRRDRAHPFFAFMNFYDAHGPYDPPAPYDTMFSGREPSTRDSETRDFAPEQVEELVAAYDGAITYVDRQLAELFAGLERRGLLENTIVIVTADHGEEFNEHGQMNHGNTLYFPGLHVPLIIAGGGDVPAGRRVSNAVSLRDVAATVLDLVRAPASAAMPGVSLARHWSARPSSLGVAGDSASPIYAEVEHTRNLSPSIPVSKGAMKSVVVDGYHYIRDAEGVEELYDIHSDPWELRDLRAEASLAGTLERARSLVSRALANDVRRSTTPNQRRLRLARWR